MFPSQPGVGGGFVPVVVPCGFRTLYVCFNTGRFATRANSTSPDCDCPPLSGSIAETITAFALIAIRTLSARRGLSVSVDPNGLFGGQSSTVVAADCAGRAWSIYSSTSMGSDRFWNAGFRRGAALSPTTQRASSSSS